MEIDVEEHKEQLNKLKQGEVDADSINLAESAALKRESSDSTLDSESLSTDSLIGTTVDSRYLVEASLKSGGQGKVYTAVHLGLKRKVVLKVIHSFLLDDKDKIQRFVREAHWLAEFDHPNLCKIYDIGVLSDGRPFIALDFIEGEDIGSFAKRVREREPKKLLRAFLQVIDGLMQAHAKGLLHRDLKPANIMISSPDDSDKFRAVLLDFGIARLQEDSPDKHLTKTGETMGTPAYMSPEQLQGFKLDLRSDIYSLGSVFFELITGKNPFEAESPFAAAFKHINEASPSLTSFLAKDNPLNLLEPVLKRCLEKSPEKRFQSLQDLREAISKSQGNLDNFVPEKHLFFLQSKSHKLIAVAAAVMIVLTAALPVLFILTGANKPGNGTSTAAFAGGELSNCDLPASKRFALALSDPVFYSVSERSGSLAPCALSAEKAEMIRKRLSALGINSAQQFKLSLAAAKDEAHRKYHESNKLLQVLQEKIGKGNRQPELNGEQRFRVDFLKRFAGSLKSKTAAADAYDIASHIAYCRMGAVCGYLSPEDAWNEILLDSKRAAASFASWKDYALSYMLGRGICKTANNDQFSDLCAVTELLSDRLSSWNLNSWASTESSEKLLPVELSQVSKHREQLNALENKVLEKLELGYGFFRSRNYQASLAALTEAYTFSQDLLNPKLKVSCLNLLSAAELASGNIPNAKRACDQTERLIYGVIADYACAYLPELQSTLSNLMKIAYLKGNYANAIRYGEDALLNEAMRVRQDNVESASTTGSLGLISFVSGNFQNAVNYYVRSLNYERAENSPNYTNIIERMEHLADAELASGKKKESEALFAEAASMRKRGLYEGSSKGVPENLSAYQQVLRETLMANYHRASQRTVKKEGLLFKLYRGGSWSQLREAIDSKKKEADKYTLKAVRLTSYYPGLPPNAPDIVDVQVWLMPDGNVEVKLKAAGKKS